MSSLGVNPKYSHSNKILNDRDKKKLKNLLFIVLVWLFIILSIYIYKQNIKNESVDPKIFVGNIDASNLSRWRTFGKTWKKL